MLRAFVDETRAQLFGDLVDVDALQQLANRGRADIGEERVVALVLGLLAEIEVLVFVSSNWPRSARCGCPCSRAPTPACPRR